jgi:hypothetical protein
MGWKSDMRQSRHKILLPMTGMIAAVLTLTACVSDGTQPPLASATNLQETAAAQAALPPNFRTLVAEYIRSHYSYPIQDAKITAPYQRWGGLLRGGTMNCVCVAIDRNNALGIVVTDHRVFIYENGKVQEVLAGTESCNSLSAFPELKA